MLKKFGLFLIVFLLDSNLLTAQTSTQNTNHLDLICRIQVTRSGVSNLGQVENIFITVIFNPPQVSMDYRPLERAIINDKAIIWGISRINRLTGQYSDYGSSGPCIKAPVQRKF
jgi:hypothetical protein